MNELKQGTEIGDYVVLYSMTNKEYTQTYCVADKNNFQFFMKVYDMRHTPDFLCNGKDPQELWAYSRLGLCDYLPRLQHSGRTTVNRTEIVYLVTKYFRGKLLSQYIEENGPMTQGEAQSVALSLVKAVKHLNHRGVCHLDITPQNILLESNSDGSFTPKLIDLEYACEWPQNGEMTHKVQRFEKINPYYSHTELLAKQKVSDSDDLFSIGAILYTMLTGKRPWADCPITSDMPAAARHLNMVNWRKEHPLESLLEPLDSVHPPLARAMELTMNGYVNAEELENLLQVTMGEEGQDSHVGLGQKTLHPSLMTGFAAIAGLDEVKQSIAQHIIWPLKHPEKAQEYRLTLPNGILLYGPPGCGKSYFASKLAEELKWKMEFVSTSSLGSKYIHETQGKIKDMFDKAAKSGHCVLCIDEIDGILSVRSSDPGEQSHNDEVNEFLVQLNECHKRGILVVGTTNRKDIMDPAVLRAGRFDFQFEITAPNTEMRKRLFEMYLSHRPLAEDLDIAELADMTEGYASVDVPFVVNEAALVAAIADLPISQDHLRNVIQNHPSSLAIIRPNPIGFR